jgi:hypothetical protein
VKRGVLRCPSTSLLLGALHLLDLYRRIEAIDVKYFRNMDDILILTPTWRKLKIGDTGAQ